MWNRWWATLALALIWQAPALAQAPKRLAVLELRGASEVEINVLRSLADKARAGALKAVVGRGYDVMTQESMAMILKDMGMDAQCQEGECEVETARNIGADLVVSGEVMRIQGRLFLSLKLHETTGGSLLATETVEGEDGLRLIRETQEASRVLVEMGLVALRNEAPSATQTFKAGRIGGRRGEFVVRNDNVVVAFESDPPGAAVLVDGELLCAETPCSRQLRAGGHEVLVSMERHTSKRERFIAKAGLTMTMNLAPKFGRVQVESTPSGINVLVNDEIMEGATPLSLKLDPGGYKVLVGNACWVLEGESINVSAGAAETVRVALKPRQSALEVSAQDAIGNAVEGEVWVDGSRKGKSPTTFKVPLCSKEVVVIAPSGQRWSEKLRLKENTEVPVFAKFAADDERQSVERNIQRASTLPPMDGPSIGAWVWWTGGLGAATWLGAGLGALAMKSHLQELSPGDPAVAGNITTGKALMVASSVGAVAVGVAVIGAYVDGGRGTR